MEKIPKRVDEMGGALNLGEDLDSVTSLFRTSNSALEGPEDGLRKKNRKCGGRRTALRPMGGRHLFHVAREEVLVPVDRKSWGDQFQGSL